MQVKLHAVGKKFHHRWIFRDINLVFRSGGKYVITGRNGSGKSTLARLLSASLRPSAGKIIWEESGAVIDPDKVFRHISFDAHYIEPTKELTLRELINFHHKFREFPKGITTEELSRISGLNAHLDKYLRHFSSGMQQRAGLALSMISKSSLVLLDEPCTSLDELSRQWYRNMLGQYCSEKTVVVVSNSNTEEYTRDFTVLDLEGM